MALAFVVLKQSFANDPVVNDPPEPSTKGTINFNGYTQIFSLLHPLVNKRIPRP
jgi:hypothetical protein